MKFVVSGAVVCVGAALALAGCGGAEQSSEVTTVRETVTETLETSVPVMVSPTVEGEASPSEVPTENPEVSPAQVPEGEADCCIFRTPENRFPKDAAVTKVVSARLGSI